jgi:hypothetical protein
VELNDAITRTLSEISNIALQKTIYVRFWVLTVVLVKILSSGM